jgi:diacylglycerol kinase family enzyme
LRFVGVLNRDGGTFRDTDMAEFSEMAMGIFAAHGHQLECRVVTGPEVETELARAAADPRTEALLAGGGDGTISMAAGLCYRHKLPLAVVPAGTMNLFARALGVPLDLTAALAALAGGKIDRVDIATANGRPFVHQFSIGIHARLVRIRETLSYRGRLGKMWASIVAVVAAVIRPPRFRCDIDGDRGRERRLTTGISVSNNLIAEGHLPHADRLDAGELGVYIIRPLSTWALLWLCVAVMRGTWKHREEVNERAVTQITLSFPRKKTTAMAVIDGELIELATSVVIRIHPKALRVIRPPRPGVSE